MSETIEKRIEIKAPAARVWRALTDYRAFGEWFRVKLEGPFVPGEISRGQITYPGYEHLKWQATVKEMSPERVFSFTWPHPASFDHPYSPEDPTTLVEFRLEETAAGTLVLLTESGFEAIPAERRAEAFARNDGGWTEQMKNIERYVVEHSE